MLQGVFELQEQAAVGNHFVSFFQTALDFRAGILTVGNFHGAAGEFVALNFKVDEWLVFGIAEDSATICAPGK